MRKFAARQGAPHGTRLRRTPAFVSAAPVAIGIALAFTGCGTDASASDAAMADDAIVEPSTTALRDASDACGGIGKLDDGDSTLLLDMEGDDIDSGDLTVENVACVLAELDAPASVTNIMSQTRALDGMQSGTWDVFEATWTYHPDNGMDVILVEND